MYIYVCFFVCLSVYVYLYVYKLTGKVAACYSSGRESRKEYLTLNCFAKFGIEIRNLAYQFKGK